MNSDDPPLPPWLRTPQRVYPREAWHRGYEDEPILLNPGRTFEEPFGVRLALAWAERLAHDRLGETQP